MEVMTERSDSWRPLPKSQSTRRRRVRAVAVLEAGPRPRPLRRRRHMRRARPGRHDLLQHRRPASARGRSFLYLALTMAPFAIVAPLIGPFLDRARGGRRWVVVAIERRSGVDLPHHDGRPRQPAALPASVRHAGAGQGLRRRPCGLGAHRGEHGRRAGGGQLQAPAPVWDRRLRCRHPSGAGDAHRRLGPGCSPWRWHCSSPPRSPALRIPRTQVAPTEASEAERAELRGIGILLAASAMGLVRGIVGFLTFLLAFDLRGGDAPTWHFGVVLACTGAGALLGSAIAPVLRRAYSEERMLVIVLGITVVAGLATAYLGGLSGAAILRGHRCHRIDHGQAGVRLARAARRARRQPRPLLRPLRDAVPGHLGDRRHHPRRARHPGSARLPHRRDHGRLRVVLLHRRRARRQRRACRLDRRPVPASPPTPAWPVSPDHDRRRRRTCRPRSDEGHRSDQGQARPRTNPRRALPPRRHGRSGRRRSGRRTPPSRPGPVCRPAGVSAGAPAPQTRVEPRPAPQAQRSMRASQRPGASTSAGVGSISGPDQRRRRPSSPARSMTPSTNLEPRS